MNTTAKNIITKAMFVRMLNIARAVFFVLGVIVCFSTNQFFKGCRKQQVAPVAAGPVHYEAITAQVLAPYDARITDLQQQNAALRAEVAGIENALSRTKRKAAALEQRLQDQITEGKTLTDTAALLLNCDSLQETALLILDESATKDSLYETLTGTLEQQVAVRDSSLAVQAQQYNLLFTGYTQLATQQQALTIEKDQYRTQYRRQRTKSRLLTAGLAIIGGGATYLLLHR